MKGLHPALAAWFHSRFREYTDIQAQAVPHTLAGRNTLILAPTGSGKTLSAFLACLSNLAEQSEAAGLPNAVCAVYVSPLKSLDRDIHKNLEGPLEAINDALTERKRVRMEVRTGDTGLTERGRQQRRRPHLLLTTPESLASLLSQRGWYEGFHARAVIVDEIHAFAENKRGSLLSLTMERLDAQSKAYTGEPLQRIGLSATAWPIEAVRSFLCGDRPCEVATVDTRKAHHLDIAVPASEQAIPPAGYNTYRVAHTVADLVERAACSLIFVSTRSAAERLGLALQILLPHLDEQIAVHHSSVERKRRLQIEEALGNGTLKAVVCSSSLELGVDFQAVDQVLLVGTPRGVSRSVQRLGRSGHRVNGAASGSLVPLSLPDLLQATALRSAVDLGHLDSLRVPEAPLDTLAQALLGMSIEREWPLAEAFQAVRRAGSYRRLSPADFDSVIRYLSGGGPVLAGNESYGKIVVENGAFRIANRKAARDYYMNVGTITGDFQVKVVARNRHRLGEVEESFIAALQPGDAFTIAGRVVALDHIHQTTAVVKPATGQRVQTPRWMGGNQMPLTASLATEELRLRADLRRAWDDGQEKACVRMLQADWRCLLQVAERIARHVARQNRAAPVPVDVPVQLERVREGRSQIVLFHVIAGRAINRTLAWLVAYRLGSKGSIVANHDDHAFLLSFAPKHTPTVEQLREAFRPDGFGDDVRRILESTEILGHSFRPVAETGQLLPRRTYRGPVPARSASWNASLLYTTLLKHEPDHPLIREAVRDVMHDQMNVGAAQAHARRIHEAPWEVFDLPRPSPFGLPLFAAFNRETLLAQDPEKALDELVAALYERWE